MSRFEPAFHVAADLFCECREPFTTAGSRRYLMWASARAPEHFVRAKAHATKLPKSNLGVWVDSAGYSLRMGSHYQVSR